MSINLKVECKYMARGECSAYSSLQADSKVKFAYELAATWCQPTFTQRTQSDLSHMVSHCTWQHYIYTVLCIIIIIII